MPRLLPHFSQLGRLRPAIYLLSRNEIYSILRNRLGYPIDYSFLSTVSSIFILTPALLLNKLPV